jgi:hypothetical protein
MAKARQSSAGPDAGKVGRMRSVSRRQSWAARWAPIVLYAIIVLGWFAEGLSDQAAGEHLRLVVWTVPAPLLYLWRTRRPR